MIVFELTMPHVGSWNGKWSQGSERHIALRQNKDVPEEIIGKDFFYRWDDGWEACVSVKKMYGNEAKFLSKYSSGFCGYDWMITSLISDGYIHTKEEQNESN